MLVLERIKTDTLNVEELDYLSSWRELDEERGEVAEAKERVAQEREEVAKELQQVTEELQQLAKEKEEVAKDKKEIVKEKEEVAKEKEQIVKELHQVKSGQYLKEVRQEVRQEVETQLAKETEEKVVLAHKLGLANALIATIMKLTVEEVNGIIERNENI